VESTSAVPLVSALIVFHRDTPYLRPTIASVLAQTFRDFELILVDNGTGLTAAALGEIGRDPRIRFVRLPRNEGIAAGHNAGVASASGEFVALLDYDDLALPERFERQVAALRLDPEMALVSALAERIDPDGRVIGSEFCFTEPAAHFAYSQFAAVVVTPAITARRQFLQDFPYRSAFPFAGDLDFQARAVERGRFGVVPEVLLQYRWYPGQTTQTRAPSLEQSRCVIQIITARRRAGRAEDLESALAVVTGAGESLSAVWRRGAELCLNENFPVVAAYQARRSLAVRRSAAATFQAFRLATRAWAQARRGQRVAVTRMFFTGPVRALGLSPAQISGHAPKGG
jgi:hypothetical protein